ncbi:hypothetical protein GCM10010310_16750 [Streptomyces violaceolatus]|uniref:Uncharacterized protein n=1 Tax=Streptomyces violaceolatus TaxID=67378 RepID=A0ABN3SDW2_9ACTN
MPLGVTQVFYESKGRPAGGQNRRGQCLWVKPVDDGQHAGSLCREERRQRLLFRAFRVHGRMVAVTTDNRGSLMPE